MNREEFIAAFEKLSPEDRQAVLAGIIAKGSSEESSESCCSGEMKEHMTEMFAKMESSGNPMAMCQEMMRMCCEKMKAHSDACD